MAYDLSNLKGNKGGNTLEVSEQESPEAGVYEHPETKEQIITTSHPLFGDAQSEGIVRLGFVRIRAAEQGEVKSIVEQILETKSETQVAASEKEELAQLRQEKAANDAKELAELKAEKKAAKEAADEAKKLADEEAAKTAAALEAGKTKTETKKEDK